MTLKNTKTILFASLIAAMILPFSGMQFAQANDADNIDQLQKIEKINQSIKETENKEKASTNEKEKQELKESSDRLKTLVQLEILDSQGLGNSDAAKAKLNKLIDMIDKQYETVQAIPVDPKDVPTIEEIDYTNQFLPLAFASTPGTQFDTYRTTLQFTQSCGTTVTGQTNGYVSQYPSHSYIQMNSDYPSQLHCDPYEYKDTTVAYTKLSGGLGSSCAITLPDNDGSAVFDCANIGTTGDALTVNTIFITANAYYDWGWVPFTALSGWASIVY